MLGLSWTELLVVGIVALIVIGPKDLPVVMGRIGKVVGQIQRMGREFQREINKTTGLDEVRNLRASITDPLKKTADEIRREFNAIGKDGQQTPTGVLKPTDPNVESVEDAIKQKAGMAAPKSSTEMATDYGFKPSVAAKPVMGVKSTPPSYADLQAAKAEEAKAAEAKPAPKPRAARTASTPKPAAAPKSAPKARAAKPKTVKLPEEPQMVAPAPEGEAKPTRKPRASKAAGSAADAVAPTKKPRAPRKKPAETAEKS